MSTYREALSASPMEFVNYGIAMADAASELLEQQAEYRANVADINGHWQDSANDAFNDDADVVAEHIVQVSGQVGSAAEQVTAAGLNLNTDVASLKSIDAAAHAQGFNVEPAPLVTLGPRQRFEILLAGFLGGPIQAMYESQAAALTAAMQAGLAMVNADDAAAASALTAASEALRPLDEKGGAPVDDDSHRQAEDHSGTGPGSGPSGSDEDSGTEEGEEDPGEPEDERPGEPESRDPSEQQPGSPQAPPENPQSPQTPSDMGDFERPDVDTDRAWGESDLGDPAEFSGGLASGAGLGGPGGLSAGTGVPAPAAGSGTGLGTGTVAPPVPTGGGPGRPGGGGSMMGAGGGGRGSGRPEEESSRESTLIEDEDFWGLNIDPDDDPYA